MPYLCFVDASVVRRGQVSHELIEVLLVDFFRNRVLVEVVHAVRSWQDPVDLSVHG